MGKQAKSGGQVKKRPKGRNQQIEKTYRRHERRREKRKGKSKNHGTAHQKKKNLQLKTNHTYQNRKTQPHQV